MLSEGERVQITSGKYAGQKGTVKSTFISGYSVEIKDVNLRGEPTTNSLFFETFRLKRVSDG